MRTKIEATIRWTAAFFMLIAVTSVRAQGSYFQAVTNLNPIGYWPLNETNPPPSVFIATNIGTLGAAGNAFYNNPYYRQGPDRYLQYSNLFTGGVPGATSDGDTAVSFNGGAGGAITDDPSGYMVIPHRNPGLTIGAPFSAEVWVYPGGGDPNDLTGASYASTEWAGIIKQGGGGAFYTSADDASGNTAGWTVSLAGALCIGNPVGWYEPGTTFLQTNACWLVDFYSGNNGNSPSMEFAVPFIEPTPQWFHLVLTYDGTNASFYTNGVLAATTVPGSSQSTNHLIAPGQAPFTTATGVNAFTPHNGVSFAPDPVNPIVLGNLNDSFAFVGDGYPNTPDGTLGFNNQVFNGLMDEVAIYTNALSASAVSQHYSDATSADHTKYTNDVLSANPPFYLRLDEPDFTNEPALGTLPVAANYGTMSGSTSNAFYQPGVTPGATGAPVAGFGPANYAAAFNGLDAGVNVSSAGFNSLNGVNPLDPQGSQPISVVAWFKANPSDSYAWFQTILGRGDQSWRFGFDGGGAVHWNPGQGPEIKCPNNLNDGAWHMVVGVSDGATAYLYVDGALSVTNSGVGAFIGSGEDFLIGGAPDYTSYTGGFGGSGNMGRYFAGNVAQVAYFGTNLTAAQVLALYNAADLLPAITRQPAGLTLGQGSSGSLSVATIGSPPLIYQWYSGTPGSGTPVTAADSSGATTSNLTFTAAQTTNSGNYFVVVTNNFGAITSSVVLLTVTPSPNIIAQPQPAASTLYVGNQISFSVGVVGASPLAYQWYNGSTRISGATASNYTFAAVVGATSLKCIITNTFGSATSSVVSVTGQTFVAPPTGFTINYNNPGIGAYQGLGVYDDAPANTNWNVFAFSANQNATSGFAKTSDGGASLVTLSTDYGFDNGANTDGGPTNSCFLVEYEAGVNSGSPGAGTAANPMGTFTFNDVPPGSYTLYVYSANYDGNRGSIINLAPANHGIADGGTNATMNVQSDHTCDSMVEGDNYVYFHNVVPDATGAINGNFVPNPAGTMTGEGQIDALQLAKAILTIQHSGTNVILTWSGGTLQSAPTVNGAWSNMAGTSPLTLPATGTSQFYRVY